MRLAIVGAGRAGGSIAIAASRSGHDVVGVVSRDGEDRFGPPISIDKIPECDLLLIAVRDAQIEETAKEIPASRHRCAVAAHVSGFIPVTALATLSDAGTAIGGMHPLQTFPGPDEGAAAIEGSYAGIGGDELAVRTLTDLAESMGMRPFSLPDSARPWYHAAAAAAANFVVTSLATAADLLDAAAIDPQVMRPLVDRVVANAFRGHPADALTGPIARGDSDTVVGHLDAAARVSEEVGRQFRLMAEATAIRAGRPAEPSHWT